MPHLPYHKPHLSYQEQLKLLKSRGLIIETDARALHILQNISYYRLSGYLYPMLQKPKTDHKYKPGSTFNNAFLLYCFDRELRQLIAGELEKIEVAIRAKMSYILSTSYHPWWFTDAAYFKNTKKLSQSIERINDEYHRSDEEFIRSFKSKYSDPFPPCWMTLEVCSFGNLATIYSNLNPGVPKRSIAHHFGLDDRTFVSWIHSLTYVRNVCAHHCRFWNRGLRVSAKHPLKPQFQFIPNTGDMGNRPTYYLLSMIIYLLNGINPKHTFKQKLYRLLKKYPNVQVQAMGFSDGWELEKLWNWKEVKKGERSSNQCIRWLKGLFTSR
jgi:abortive infection bacteriophage resistance protein